MVKTLLPSLASFFIVLAGTMHIPAFGQQVALQTAEPKRFALVIGNARYGEPVGSLPLLGSPCNSDDNKPSDAKAIADALATTKWEVELRCNLTTVDLRTAISDFNDRILAEPRAFGLIYFSGHGAQVAGTNYLFGVDADIDPDLEAAKYRQNSYAPLFGKGAISLDREMGKIQPLWGKAVVVIVDACRDNPIVDKLQELKISTARYPAPSSQPANVVYAFATALGEPAPDGGPGKLSRYSRVLAETIKKHHGEKGPEEIEQILSRARATVMKESGAKQVPAKVGELQRPPFFCLQGCASPISEWDSWNEQFTSRVPAWQGIAGVPMMSGYMPVRSVYSLLTAATGPVMRKTSFQLSGQQELAARPHISQEQRPSSALGEDAAAGLLRKVNVDILFCGGVAGVQDRERRGAELGSYISGLSGARSPISGFEIGKVRLMPMPAKANQAIYHVDGAAIIYSEGSPALEAWAKNISAASALPLPVQARAGSSSDYLTIVLCDAVRPNAKPPTIYIQVASEVQKPIARELRNQLVAGFPEWSISRTPEVLKDSPIFTEVRYFAREHASYAEQIADTVSLNLQTPVKAKLVRGYEEKLRNLSVIELWVGKGEGSQVN